MKVKRFFASFILTVVCLLSTSVCFGAESPVEMLDRISKQMLSALKADRANIQQNPAAVYEIVNRLLLPHANVTWMARSVLGRSGAWENATPAAREKFKKELVTLIEHTYGTALSTYTNEQVVFFPLREDWQGKDRIQVESQIIRQGGQPISVNYRLGLAGNRWLVLDFTVDGVSMIQSFRSQFANDLAQDSSLELLTEKLHRHNSNPTAEQS